MRLQEQAWNYNLASSVLATFIFVPMQGCLNPAGGLSCVCLAAAQSLGRHAVSRASDAAPDIVQQLLCLARQALR